MCNCPEAPCSHFTTPPDIRRGNRQPTCQIPPRRPDQISPVAVFAPHPTRRKEIRLRFGPGQTLFSLPLCVLSFSYEKPAHYRRDAGVAEERHHREKKTPIFWG